MLREFKKVKNIAGEAQTVEHVQHLEALADKFVSCDTSKPKTGEEEFKRLANLLCLRGLDHALQTSMGLSLCTFFANAHLKAVQPHEERYYVPAADLPPGACTDARLCRAAIEDKNTGRRRLELREADAKWRLHTASDTGSQGWVGLNFLYTRTPVIGSYMWDEMHKNWRSVLNASSRAGLMNALYSLLMVMNFKHAPFKSHAFFSKLHECAKYFFATFTHEFVLFRTFYARIFQDFQMDPAYFGTEQSYVDVWTRCKNCKFWQKLGSKVRMAVWFDIFSEYSSSLKREWHCILMLLLFMSLRGEVVSDISDLPCFGGDPLGFDARGHVAPVRSSGHAHAHAGHGGVAMSNNPAEELRGKTIGSVLKFTMITMGNDTLRKLIDCMAVLVLPCRKAHGLCQTQGMTRRGSRELAITAARGQDTYELKELVGALSQRSTLLDMGLLDDNFKGSDIDDVDDVLQHFFMFLCTCLASVPFTSCGIAGRCLSSQWHCWTLMLSEAHWTRCAIGGPCWRMPSDLLKLTRRWRVCCAV